MTPTKEEIAFFTSEEAKRIQELWEPKWGDPVYHENYGYGIITSMYDAPWYYRVDFELAGSLEACLENLVFLPRQGQLQAMLEEMGEIWRQGKIDRLYQSNWVADDLIDKDDWYWASVRPKITAENRIIKYGPTPCIALGRALVEVLGEQTKATIR